MQIDNVSCQPGGANSQYRPRLTRCFRAASPHRFLIDFMGNLVTPAVRLGTVKSLTLPPQKMKIEVIWDGCPFYFSFAIHLKRKACPLATHPKSLLYYVCYCIKVDHAITRSWCPVKHS